MVVGLKPKEVYQMNKAYQVYKFKKIQNNLSRLKEAIKNNQDSAAWDDVALIHDCAIHPFPTVTPHGYCVWHQTYAEQYLKEDVKAKQ
jgi:hypothetical protein